MSKGKGWSVSKKQILCDLACSRECPCAECPYPDIFPSDRHALLPRRLPLPCPSLPAHAAVTLPPNMAGLKLQSRPACQASCPFRISQIWALSLKIILNGAGVHWSDASLNRENSHTHQRTHRRKGKMKKYQIKNKGWGKLHPMRS